jgi:hypothetical protein
MRKGIAAALLALMLAACTVEAPTENKPRAAAGGSAPAVTDKAEPQYTVSQEQAIMSAESYLDMGGFSEKSLIDQLKFEKFSAADAKFAVNHVSVDWDEQALMSAKSYLDMGGFSRDSLIGQLKFEGFTIQQATYAVNKVGL